VQSDAPLPHFFALGCVFDDVINLSETRLDGLWLRRCDLAGIEAPGACVLGSVDLTASHITAIEGRSVRLDGAEIQGSVLLTSHIDRAFTAKGSVRLLGARIGGDMDACGASLDGQGDAALACDRATFQGDVFLMAEHGRSFVSRGPVRLIGATIEGDLNIGAALLDGQGNSALIAERLDVAGSIFIRPSSLKPLTIIGSLSFCTARIGANCQITGLTLTSGRDGVCIDFEGVRVERELLISQVFGPNGGDRPVGTFNFTAAHVSRLHDDPVTGWPMKGHLELDGFTYDSIHLAQRTGGLSESLLTWLMLQCSARPSPHEFKPQPFEQLARTLRAVGYSEEADKVAVAKRTWRRRCQVDAPAARLTSWFMGLVANHGYSPVRALVVTMAYWLIGAVIITAGLRLGMLEFFMTNPPGARATLDYVAFLPRSWSSFQHPAAADLVVAGTANGCPALVTPLYALDLIIPVLDLGQESACRLETHGVIGGLVQTGRVLYQLFGAILTAITITTLTGVLRKD